MQKILKNERVIDQDIASYKKGDRKFYAHEDLYTFKQRRVVISKKDIESGKEISKLQKFIQSWRKNQETKINTTKIYSDYIEDGSYALYYGFYLFRSTAIEEMRKHRKLEV